MTTVSLSTVQVTELIDLLTVTAAGADDEDRCRLDHCREQLGELMAPIEVLVLAGVLREMTERPGQTRSPGRAAAAGAPTSPGGSATHPRPASCRWPPEQAARSSAVVDRCRHADRGVSPVVVAFWGGEPASGVVSTLALRHQAWRVASQSCGSMSLSRDDAARDELWP